MNEPIHIRLVNGDELIGELESTSNTEIMLKRPMLVSEVTDEKTKIATIVLSKYILFDDDQVFPFSKTHIVTQTNILDEIKSYYYNSIEYNSKFVEPVIRQELSKVNKVMENILRAASLPLDETIIHRSSKMEEKEGDDDFRFLHPGSKTVN